MKTYKVLKDFILNKNEQPKAGDDFYGDDDNTFIDFLLGNGFIEYTSYELWKPKKSEDYFAVTANGSLQQFEWTDWIFDSEVYNVGNCFQTEEEGKKAIEWLKALKVLRDDTKGFKPDWKNRNQRKWYVDYELDNGLVAYWSASSNGNIIHFATERDAEESIKNHKKEWLTFYSLGDNE